MAFRNTRLVLMAVVVSLSLAACGQRDPGARSEPLDNFTAEQIWKRGEYELENTRQPESAIYYFSEIERLYPYSEWAKRALIMQAFSHHRAKQYEEARGAAQRFIDTYPGDQDEAYAKYLLALSYYDQIDEVGRDQGLTFQALQALREVIEQLQAVKMSRRYGAEAFGWSKTRESISRRSAAAEDGRAGRAWSPTSSSRTHP